MGAGWVYNTMEEWSKKMMEQVDGKMMGNMLENDDKAHDKAVDLGYLQSWTKLDALG